MLDKSSDPRFARSRLALVGAMTELLDERDIAGISITDLVGRAQVTRPTFYQHFRDIAAAARLASVTRLEAAFPTHGYEECGQDDAARAAAIEETVTGLLQHLSDHAQFYRRVIGGASAVELYDDFVSLLETRIMNSSPLGARIRSSTGVSAEDRGAVLSGGLTWLIIRWLHSDFSNHNAIPVMARRIAAVMIAFA